MSEIIGNIIALLSVLVTGFFTYLVFKATEATANATKATLKLSEELASKEENRINEQRRIMRRLLLPIVAKESKAVHDAVVDIDPMNINRKLKVAPSTLSINKTDLAEYFSVDEVAAIIKAWESYESYRTTYYKETYRGDEIKLLLEKNLPIIMNFTELNDTLSNIEV